MAARNLTQDELDAHHRQHFTDQILKALTPGATVRFIVHKEHYNLVEIANKMMGEYTMSIAHEHRYTYRFSHLVDFIEQLYDRQLEVIPLRGEVQITCTHVQANE